MDLGVQMIANVNGAVESCLAQTKGVGRRERERNWTEAKGGEENCTTGVLRDPTIWISPRRQEAPAGTNQRTRRYLT